MPEVLRDFGVAPEALFRAEGIPIDLFSDPDHAIPFEVLSRLLARCVRETGRDDLALLICEKAGASNLGLIGFLLQQAPDVRSALGVLVRYLHHTDQGGVPFLSESADQVSLGYSIYAPVAEGCDQIYDGAIAVGTNIMRALCGPQWSPTEVRLSRRRPPAPAAYERFFGAPVRFDSEESAILFPARWLETSRPGADGALRRMLQEQIDLLEVEETGLSERVIRLLRSALLTGSPSVDQVSAHLGITRRTLARRLEAEGTTFKQLSDAIHYEVAQQLLLNTSLSLTRIGLALNYSEASAFTRAFRKWSGTSPRNWRAGRAGEGERSAAR